MKKLSLVLSALILIGFAIFVGYEVYLPEMIAMSITTEPSSLVPDNIESRLQKIRKPVNDGAKTVVETMHKSGVTMDQILKAIDDTEEEQAFAFLNEISNMKIESSDQIFTVAKKHFPVEFDVEIFREPFNKKVNIASIKKGIRYANIYKDKEEFDAATAKSIAKRILLQKEEEFKRLTGIN
jgi:hypothetical protein